MILLQISFKAGFNFAYKLFDVLWHFLSESLAYNLICKYQVTYEAYDEILFLNQISDDVYSYWPQVSRLLHYSSKYWVYHGP
jgi:hypothetical protein